MREIRIYNEINNELCEKVSFEIKNAKDSGEKEIKLLINSPGGMIEPAMAVIYEAIAAKEAGVKIYTENVGIAFSMAAVFMQLASAGCRTAYDYSLLLYHYAHIGGSAPTPEQSAELKKYDEALFLVTGLDKKVYTDKRMTAQEALALGIIDSVKASRTKEALACVSAFNYIDFDTFINFKQEMDVQKQTEPMAQNFEALKAENEALLAQINSFKASVEAQNEASALQAVNSLLDDQKILLPDGMQKSEVEEAAKAIAKAGQLSALNTILRTIRTPQKAAEAVNSASFASALGDRAYWTFKDWVNKDPEGFNNLPQNVQNKIEENYYGK